MENHFSFMDERLNRRAMSSFLKIMDMPNEAIPNIFSEYSELEGFYRLMKNPRVNVNNFLDSMINNTVNNIRGDEELLVIHDTTFVNPNFNKRSKNFSSHGIGAHLSLVAKSSNESFIYGGVNVQFLNRDQDNRKFDLSNEGKRWINGVIKSEEILTNNSCIHLMDREGDTYSHYCEMNLREHRYIIRNQRMDFPTFIGQFS